MSTSDSKNHTQTTRHQNHLRLYAIHKIRHYLENYAHLE